MSTRMRVVILVGIVVLIIGLLVLDRNSSRRPSTEESYVETERVNPEVAQTPPLSQQEQGKPQDNVAKAFDNAPKQENPPQGIESPKERGNLPEFKRGQEEQGKTDINKGAGVQSKDKKAQDQNTKEKPPAKGNEFELPPQEEQTEEYVIKSGDMLENIARAKYGSSGKWKLIVEANPGINPNNLKVGQKIKIPALKKDATKKGALARGKKIDNEIAKNKPEGEGEVPQTYTTQSGDSLYKIAMKFYKTPTMIDKIYEANKDKMSSPSDLSVGVTLNLPDKNDSGEQAKTEKKKHRKTTE